MAILGVVVPVEYRKGGAKAGKRGNFVRYCVEVSVELE